MKWSDLGLEFSQPSLFSRSQWEAAPSDAPQLWYVAVRLLVSLFWMANFISLLAIDANYFYFFIYLTHQVRRNSIP